MENACKAVCNVKHIPPAHPFDLLLCFTLRVFAALLNVELWICDCCLTAVHKEQMKQDSGSFHRYLGAAVLAWMFASRAETNKPRPHLQLKL